MRSLLIPNSVIPSFKIPHLCPANEVISSISETENAQKSRAEAGQFARTLLSMLQSGNWRPIPPRTIRGKHNTLRNAILGDTRAKVFRWALLAIWLALRKVLGSPQIYASPRPRWISICVGYTYWDISDRNVTPKVARRNSYEDKENYQNVPIL